MEERDARLDALLTEVRIMLYFHNQQITMSLTSGIEPERIGVQISQADLVTELDGIGHAVLERTCKRLVEMGRLQRQRRVNRREKYTYHVSREAIGAMMYEIVLRASPMIREDEHGRVLELELILPGNTKAAGRKMDEFFAQNS